MNIRNKNILFFSPSFFGYEKAIKRKLEEYGAYVDFYDDRPMNGFWTKAFIRVNKRILFYQINKYYNTILSHLELHKYDYVFVLNAEAMPVKFLRKIKGDNSNAVFVLYMWDSFLNRKNTCDYLEFFDYIFSFDKNDCIRHPKIHFRPLFYMTEYADIVGHHNYKYDFCFIGTAHSDRFALIKKLQKMITQLGQTSYWFLYLQSKKLFFWNKLTNSNFREAKIKDFNYTSLTKDEILNKIAESRIVIDIHHPNQLGLTMRVLEMLGAQKKIITTNASVKEYDFYLPDNICVIDRLHPQLDKSFMICEYVPLSQQIYHKYSIDGWLEEIFQIVTRKNVCKK